MHKIKLNNVKDKSISVGESSDITVKNIRIFNSTTGIAVKDSSYANISNSTFNSIKENAIFAYNKKSTFSGATAIVSNCIYNDVNNKFISQNGSRIINNGKIIKSEDVDIKFLYDSGYMKK